ncbi:hypothetical protein LPJ61_007037, partial [Coemansia biformis]
VNAWARDEVPAAHGHLQRALRYVDVREPWGAVCMTGLQRIRLESSDGDKESRTTDRLVARSCFSETERDSRLCQVLREAAEVSGQ